MTFNIRKINEQLYIFKIYLILGVFLFTSLSFNEDLVSARYDIKLIDYIDTLKFKDFLLSILIFLFLYNYFYIFKVLHRKKIILIFLVSFLSLIISSKFIFLNEYRLFLSNSIVLPWILAIFLNPNYENLSYKSLSKFCYCLTSILSFVIVVSLFDYNRDTYKWFEAFVYESLPQKTYFDIMFIFFKWFDSSAIRNPLYLIILLSIIFNFYLFLEKKKISYYLILSTIIHIYFLFRSSHLISEILLIVILSLFLIRFLKKFFTKLNFNKKYILLIYFCIILSPFIYTKTNLVILKKVLIKYDYFLMEIKTKTFDKKNKCTYKYPIEYQHVDEIREILTFRGNACYGNHFPIHNNIWLLSSFAQRVMMSDNYFKFLNFESIFIGIDARSYVLLTKSIAPKDFPPSVRSKLNKISYTHNSYANLFYRYGILISLIFIIFFYNEIIKNKKNFYFLLVCFVILFSQCFDDYLFGNRIETTLLLWLMMALSKNMSLKEN